MQLGAWVRLSRRAAAVAALVAPLAVALPAQEPARSGQPDEEVGPLMVRGLSFDGNDALSDALLRRSIRTTNSSWFARFFGFLGRKRYLDETDFRGDVERIKGLYGVSGYVEARIDTVVDRSRPGSVDIRFRIDEGEPVRVASLDVTGTEGILVPARLADLPLRRGAPFNRLLLEASADSLQGMLRDRGYPFALVLREFTVIRDSAAAHVVLHAEPGRLARVERVTVGGAVEVDESVVRRWVPVRPGQIYSARTLRESQLDLYRLGAYSFVSVDLVDSLPDDATDSLVTVHVRVREAPLRHIRMGAGYATIDCFRSLGTWAIGDFLGGGRTLRFDASLSKIGAEALRDNVCFRLGEETDPNRLKLDYNLRSSLHEPFFLSRRTSATLSGFGERYTEFNAYVREERGGEVSFTRGTPRGIPVTVSYTLGYTRTVASTATYCQFLLVCNRQDAQFFTDLNRRGTLGLLVLRDRTDAPLNPSRGNRFTVQVRHASGLTLSDSLNQFTKVVGEFSSYHGIGSRAVFAWRVRAGVIFPPDPLSLLGQRAEFVPPDERFYAGGAGSVRGFAQNELGPVVRVIDTAGSGRVVVVGPDTLRGRVITSPTGGNSVFLANAELRAPIAGSVFGSLFVDVGRVRAVDRNAFGFGGVKATPGVGLHIASPLGPVRFDVGYNPYDPEPGPLLLEVGDDLVPLLDDYAPPAPGFWDRLQLHLAIGATF